MIGFVPSQTGENKTLRNTFDVAPVVALTRV
jgi:hypothetical protein